MFPITSHRLSHYLGWPAWGGRAGPAWLASLARLARPGPAGLADLARDACARTWGYEYAHLDIIGMRHLHPEVIGMKILHTENIMIKHV